MQPPLGRCMFAGATWHHCVRSKRYGARASTWARMELRSMEGMRCANPDPIPPTARPHPPARPSPTQNA
eukprot:11199797-Lingulodinium_polyedra.AAC.1